MISIIKKRVQKYRITREPSQERPHDSDQWDLFKLRYVYMKKFSTNIRDHMNYFDMGPYHSFSAWFFLHTITHPHSTSLFCHIVMLYNNFPFFSIVPHIQSNKMKHHLKSFSIKVTHLVLSFNFHSPTLFSYGKQYQF